MIELYLWNSCPFCQKVVKAANELKLQEGVHFKIIDGAPGTAGREVVEKRGGKAMVPFLVDGETAMYESDDIISYLKNVKI